MVGLREEHDDDQAGGQGRVQTDGRRPPGEGEDQGDPAPEGPAAHDAAGARGGRGHP